MNCLYAVWILSDGDSIINPLRAKFFSGNKNIYSHSVSFRHIDITQVDEIRPQVRQEPIIHSQYHGCWCPGDARSQDIRSHDIGYVEPN